MPNSKQVYNPNPSSNNIIIMDNNKKITKTQIISYKINK